MKTILLACLLLCAALPQVGCKSLNKNAYRTVGTVQISAEAAMEVWKDYVKAKNPPLELKQRVKDAFVKYQAATAVAIDAARAYSVSDLPSNKSRLDIAMNAASTSLSDLVTLVQVFTAKTP